MQLAMPTSTPTTTTMATALSLFVACCTHSIGLTGSLRTHTYWRAFIFTSFYTNSVASAYRDRLIVAHLWHSFNSKALITRTGVPWVRYVRGTLCAGISDYAIHSITIVVVYSHDTYSFYPPRQMYVYAPQHCRERLYKPSIKK